MKITRTFLIITAIVACLGVGRAVAKGGNPGIVPHNANAHGKSYGELAAAWWQWAAETPTPDNALIDDTGANCTKNQTDHVWFLAGSFGSDPVTRTCKVPNGTFLFFPLVNDAYFAFLNDPDDQRTEDFVRSQTTCIVGAELTAEIDGVTVNDPAQYLGESPLFTVHLPTDNIFGAVEGTGPGQVPLLTLDPSVDRGYYLYLNPLTPGRHTIHFTSAQGAGCPDTPTQDVTYILTVGK